MYNYRCIMLPPVIMKVLSRGLFAERQKYHFYHCRKDKHVLGREDHALTRFSILDKYIRADQLMKLFTLHINEFDSSNCIALKQFSVNMESHINSPSLIFCTVYEINL